MTLATVKSCRGRWSAFALSAVLTLPAAARQLELDVGLATPVVRAGQQQTVFLKVALTGFEVRGEADRAPVNVAIVLDRSGSMRGEKLARAREAAVLALERLGADDVAAVVSYDSTVRVDLPATKVTDKNAIRDRIEAIRAGGRTALFAGVSKGAGEVQKFLDPTRVNRVILLSDGIANVGPHTPAALGRLGASLGAEGIAVSTVGLGLDYNEDLLTRLAGMSDGNHAFAETAADLAGIFDREFGDVLSVAGQDVQVWIRCAPGVRPVRVLGRSAEIGAGEVRLSLNQVYSRQEKFIMLELEVPPGSAGEALPLAGVEVSYINALSGGRERLAAGAEVSFSASERRVSEAADGRVMTDLAQQVANEMSKEAVALRDQGRVREAAQKLEASADYLDDYAERYNAPALRQFSDELKDDAEQIDDNKAWNQLRKTLKQKQYVIENQQRQ